MSASHRTHLSEQGSTLASALLLVALMSVVALSVTSELRFAMRRSVNMETRDQAHWYAMGVRDYSEAYIHRSVILSQDNLSPETTWLSEPLVFPLENGRMISQIKDGNNCFNINSLIRVNELGEEIADEEKSRRFITLLQAAGLSENISNVITAQIIDWIDRDMRMSLSGAEDPVYARQAIPYRTGNTRMAEREELLALNAMTSAIYARLAPLVCTRPDSNTLALNINTLKADQWPLLVAVFDGELSPLGAEILLQSRPPSGFSTADEFWALNELDGLGEANVSAQTDLIGIETEYFEIDILVEHDGMRYQLSEVIKLMGEDLPHRLSQRFGMFS